MLESVVVGGFEIGEIEQQYYDDNATRDEYVEELTVGCLERHCCRVLS